MRYSPTALALIATFPFASAGAQHHRPDTCPSTSSHFPLQECPVGNQNNVPLSTTSQQADEEFITRSNTWNETGLCVQSYCLYTNPSFANNRGISIITTPPNLALFKSLTSSSQPHTSASSPSPYTISPIPKKGLGLLATRALPRGTPIMSHPPTLLIHRTFLESHPPTNHRQALLDAAVSSLPPLTRDLFLSQMGSHQGGHKVTDILATNSFQTDLGGSDGHHYGNYPPVSRFNHDCRPNVAFHIDPRTLTHRTTTVREVQQGEELTISYLDSFAPREERRQRALGAWGFVCGCEQCRLPHREGEKSDRRLEEIARLRGVLEDVDSAERVDGRMVRRWVKLFKDERLDFAMAAAWTVAALNWNMLGEEEMARKYARLAVEAGEIEFGPEGEEGDVKDMRELERSPREHVSWGRRVGGGGEGSR